MFDDEIVRTPQFERRIEMMKWPVALESSSGVSRGISGVLCGADDRHRRVRKPRWFPLLFESGREQNKYPSAVTTVHF